MERFIRKHFVSIFVVFLTAFSYAITVLYYYFQYKYYGIPNISFSPTLSQIVTVMFLVLVTVTTLTLGAFLTKKWDDFIEKKIRSTAGKMLILVIFLVALTQMLSLLNFIIGSVILVSVFFFILADHYHYKKKQPYTAIIFLLTANLLFVAFATVCLSLGIVSEKLDYPKIKGENYLMVMSSNERDIYKEFDFENKQFIESFKYIPISEKVDVELINIAE